MKSGTLTNTQDANYRAINVSSEDIMLFLSDWLRKEFIAAQSCPTTRLNSPADIKLECIPSIWICRESWIGWIQHAEHALPAQPSSEELRPISRNQERRPEVALHVDQLLLKRHQRCPVLLQRLPDWSLNGE